MSSDSIPLSDHARLAHSKLESLLAHVRKLSAPIKAGHYDELRNDKGELREAWKTFFAYLGESGLQNLPGSSETISRLIQQNGITYNVYADDQDQTRPWSLNPLPLLIEPDEWRTIATSLQQRAKLLNAILQDVYSKQFLIRGGYLPAALVLGNPGYLRAMQGVKPLVIFICMSWRLISHADLMVAGG